MFLTVAWGRASGCRSEGAAVIEVRLRIADAYHIYAPGAADVVPTSIALAASARFAIGAIDWPAAKTVHDAALGKDIDTYEGELTITVPIRVAADAPVGEAALKLTVRLQACDDKTCLLPQEYVLLVPITIERGR